MGYKTKSMLNQASGLDVKNKLKQELNKNKTDKAYKKQAKSIGTYVNEGGEKKYKKSQRKEARAVGKEAAKNVDTSFEGAKLAGTDFNSLLIGTIQNISESGKASGKKRKIKRDARKEHQELQKKGSSNFDGKGLKEGFKGADLPKIDSGIKTGDFFQNTFNKFNPERDKSIKKGPQKPDDPFLVPKITKNPDKIKPDKIKPYKGNLGSAETQIVVPGSDVPGSKYNLNEFGRNLTAQDEANKKLDEEAMMSRFKNIGLVGVPMMGDGFSKGMFRKNKYNK